MRKESEKGKKEREIEVNDKYFVHSFQVSGLGI